MSGRIALAVTLWAAAVAFAASDNVQALWKEAVRLQMAGEYTAALPKYESILRIRAGFVPALSNLGAVYSRLGRYEEAAAQYRKAIAIEPGHFGIRLNLALALYNQFRLAEAIAELEQLQRTQPGNEQVRMVLADSLLRTGENGKVISLLREQESSDDRAVAYLLGTALIRDGQVSRGQRIIDRLFRDGSAEALLLLASAQMAAEENKAALGTLGQAIAANPKLPEAHSLYGQAKLNDGDPEVAKEAFRAELALNPFDFQANLQLGALHRVEKDYRQAGQYLERAQRIRPASLALKYQIASLRLAEGSLPEAVANLEEVTREAPAFVEGHITLATAYYRSKRKADGDRERAVVERLNAEQQSRELRK